MLLFKIDKMKMFFSSITLLLFMKCENSFRNETISDLTNNDSKCWYIDFNNETNKKYHTLWYFSSNGNYFDYYYNIETYELELKDYDDNLPINKFEILTKDTILLYNRKFPIIKISKQELILKNVYGNEFFPDKLIFLKSCSNLIKNHIDILQKMETLIDEFYDNNPDLKDINSYSS